MLFADDINRFSHEMAHIVPDFVMITQPLSKARMQGKWNQKSISISSEVLLFEEVEGAYWFGPVRPSVIGYGQEPVEVGLDLEIVYIEQA